MNWTTWPSLDGVAGYIVTDLRPTSAWPRGSNASAIAYGYDTLAGYIREHAGENLVMNDIGDHQPPAAVSGRTASHEVPVHVITSRPALLRQPSIPVGSRRSTRQSKP